MTWQQDGDEVIGAIFICFICLFFIGTILPAIGLFDECIPASFFERPYCELKSIFSTFQPRDTQTAQLTENQRLNKQEFFSTIKKEEEATNNQKEPTLSVDELDTITSHAKLVNQRYQECFSFIQDGISKVERIRDQATLYQYDDRVNNCVKEYLKQAGLFSQLVSSHKDKMSLSELRELSLMNQARSLQTIARKYAQLSQNRHHYIHGTYQTQQLITLGILISQTTVAVASEQPSETIQSLQALHEWWYHNGGVIDTGWSR